MNNDSILLISDLRERIVKVLLDHNTSAENAAIVADALISAEIDGQKGHGISRLKSYAAQAASGKVDGHAVPLIERVGGAAVRVDAGGGFAFPALRTAIKALDSVVRDNGIGIAAVHHSHHFGQAGYHVESLAESGLMGLIFGNSPQAISPWGGSKALFGTNPIAFAAPRQGKPPLLIDLSLSEVARGKVMLAAKENREIPEDWALDSEGKATTDPHAALQGSMLPMGGAKGAVLVLMVEILAAALTGANFGFEASSFFDAEGAPPGVGQVLIGIDPQLLSGGAYAARLDVLIDAILAQEGTRLPGEGRHEKRAHAKQHGIGISEKLLIEIDQLKPQIN